MPRFERNTESVGFTWAYRDLLTALLIVFIAMAALSLVAVSRTPPAKNVPIQGNLIVTLHWDRSSNSDIDLWVKSPGDEPVGFRRRSGSNCNLLRDDLGRERDRSSENEEMIVCRNAPAGPYVVNVMSYHVYDGRLPVQVSVEGIFGGADTSNRIFRRNARLTDQGQELTVVRFELTKDGTLVRGSLNEIPVSLFRSDR
jgi:hypothetical protein